jgi:2-iminobutanoate/2-iminopropanoate deaminase
MRRLISMPGIPTGDARISHATIWGNLIFVSGLVAREPLTGRPRAGGVKVQTRLIFENLCLILASAGSGKDLILKIGCFLQDMSEFEEFNSVWNEFFLPFPPARICVEGKIAPGYEVEIDAVAGIVSS